MPVQYIKSAAKPWRWTSPLGTIEGAMTGEGAMTARDEPRPARVDERPRPTQGAGLEPRIKLWLEKDGALVLSDFRVQLLRHLCARCRMLLASSSNNGPSPRLKAVRYFAIWCHQN